MRICVYLSGKVFTYREGVNIMIDDQGSWMEIYYRRIREGGRIYVYAKRKRRLRF